MIRTYHILAYFIFQMGQGNLTEKAKRGDKGYFLFSLSSGDIIPIPTVL